MNGNNYFDKRTAEEDSPVVLDTRTQKKYQHLETIFEEFFEQNGLSIAKVEYCLIQQSSKEERDKKGLNDSSYVYGEVVNLLIFRLFDRSHLFSNT
jgi:hypothetical protein